MGDGEEPDDPVTHGQLEDRLNEMGSRVIRNEKMISQVLDQIRDLNPRKMDEYSDAIENFEWPSLTHQVLSLVEDVNDFTRQDGAPLEAMKLEARKRDMLVSQTKYRVETLVEEGYVSELEPEDDTRRFRVLSKPGEDENIFEERE